METLCSGAVQPGGCSICRLDAWMHDPLGAPPCPWPQAVVKACAGNFTIFPLYLGSFFLYMGLLEGLRPAQAVQKLRQAFLPT